MAEYATAPWDDKDEYAKEAYAILTDKAQAKLVREYHEKTDVDSDVLTAIVELSHHLDTARLNAVSDYFIDMAYAREASSRRKESETN